MGTKLYSLLSRADYAEARQRLGLSGRGDDPAVSQTLGFGGQRYEPLPADRFSSPAALDELVAVIGSQSPQERSVDVASIAALASRHPRDAAVRAVEAGALAVGGQHGQAARGYARVAILLAEQSESAALYMAHKASHQYQLAGEPEAAILLLVGLQEQWSSKPTPTLDLGLAALDRHAGPNLGRALHGAPGAIVDAVALQLEGVDDAAEALIDEFSERVTQLRRLSHAMARLSSQDQLELRGQAVVSLAARATTSKSPLLQPAAGLPIDHAYETGQVVRPDPFEIDLRPPSKGGSEDLWPGVTRRRRGEAAAERETTPMHRFASLAADENQLWVFVNAQSEEISSQLTALAAAIDPEGERTQQVLTLPPDSESDDARAARATKITQVRIASLLAGVLLLTFLLSGPEGGAGTVLLAASVIAGLVSLVLGLGVWNQARGAAEARREHLRYESAEEQRRAAEEVIRRDRMARIAEVRAEVAEVEGELRKLRRSQPLLPRPLALADGTLVA